MRGPYYGLIIYDNGQFQWEFGSFDRSDVVCGRDDYHDKGYRLKDMQVMRFEVIPSQGQINQMLTAMNSALDIARTN